MARLKKIQLLSVVALFLLLAGTADGYTGGRIFKKVVQVLESRYYNEEFIEEALPPLVKVFRPAAERSESLFEERQVIHRFLSKIPASHLAIYSKPTYRGIIRELASEKSPMFGFNMVELEGKLFVYRILDGGPASQAGLLSGDRIVRVNEVNTSYSQRLDWRSDDAHLPDPPVHQLLCNEGDEVTLLVERFPGAILELTISAGQYSGFDAAKASCRTYVNNGKQWGYIHYWYIHHQGPAKLLREKFQSDFKDCDGFVLDLRGRGGSLSMVSKILSSIRKEWSPRPLVVLVDRGTRSAKEIIAYEIQKQGLGKLVGETTAGAVLPATFKSVGQNTILMFPGNIVTKHSDILEGVGVKPDVQVNDVGPYGAGSDPILAVGLQVLDGSANQI